MNKTKSFLWIILTLMFTLSLTSCVLTPADYCEKILNSCGDIKNGTSELANLIATKDVDKIQAKYDENLQKINKTIADFQKMGDWQGNKDLIEAGIRYVEFYKRTYENQYSKFIEILKKENKTYEDGDVVAFAAEDIAEESIKVEQDLINNFSKFTKEFGLITTSY